MFPAALYSAVSEASGKPLEAQLTIRVRYPAVLPTSENLPSTWTKMAGHILFAFDVNKLNVPVSPLHGY